MRTGAPYKARSSRVLLIHPRLTVAEDLLELPDGQEGDYLWFVGGRDAVTVIPRDPAGKILVEREYSYLPNQPLYQFPGGGMEDGEAPAAAANRELMEELNQHAGRLILLGQYLMDHRRSHAKMFVFLGEELTERQSTTRDKYEVDLQASWLTETEIEALISGGRVINAAMLASWALYKNRLDRAA
ncbi:MAG: NUDIX hydrolase [Cytophagales bacterium]|nr:NUDIX hydrolase [Armatimonadota bacterium]